jgi:5'-deoxynucleotidase YfbR-like HD superfamily hydrolase
LHIDFETLASKYYKLKNLVRYQTSPRIHDESVLEHLAVTAALVAKLADEYEFDQLKAIRLALFHDYAESEISDIPHPCKKRLSEEMQRELEAMEVDVVRKDLGDEIAQSLEDFNDLNESPESLVVALADAYSVMLYSKSESSLGNKEWYEGYVIPYTAERIGKLKSQLKPYLK